MNKKLLLLLSILFSVSIVLAQNSNINTKNAAEKEFEIVYELAKNGDATSQLSLGFCYAYGDGVQQNYAEAVKWFRLSAEQGSANAQVYLGFCYFLGDGVQQNYAEAVKWFRLSAEQGNANAQFNLGICYYSGSGVQQNYAEAVKWLELAAKEDPYYEKDLKWILNK